MRFTRHVGLALATRQSRRLYSRRHQSLADGMFEPELHSRTGVGESGEYLSREVTVKWIGTLVSQPTRSTSSYQAFGLLRSKRDYRIHPDEIARKLKEGIERAERIAKSHNMVRAFAIAPTASCSYRSTDSDGFTSTPEIAPPISRTVDRDSGTFGVQTYEYGDVEIASEVGWYAYVSPMAS